MKKDKMWYGVAFVVLTILLRPFYWMSTTGRQNIPDGPVVVCANHSSWVDPILIAFALGRKYHLHMMAKIELFRSKILGGIISGIGSFPVDRSCTDLSAIKTALRYLRHGEKVGIFPEGTRCEEDGMVDAKRGAVRIADKANVPIVPVYLPRKKRLFCPMKVVIGAPIPVNPDKRKLSSEDYDTISGKLMHRINGLGNGVAAS